MWIRGGPAARSSRRGHVGLAVVADQVHVQALGDLGVDLGQELLELDGAVFAVQAGDYGPVGGVQGREQGCGSVPDAVVGAILSGMPGIIGKAGCDRARSWTCDFSSTDSITADSGWFR